MAKVNTEKPAGKDQSNKIQKPIKKSKETGVSPLIKDQKEEIKTENESTQVHEEKSQVKKHEVKKVKKSETSVEARNLKVSTKDAISLCRFILNKKLDRAIKDMEEVSKMKKAVPMKGEYSHQKGKIMSGRYPMKAGKEFLVLLKSLQGNANNHDINSPVITLAFANKGPAVYASGGRTRKRTHIKIVASEKKGEGKK